MPRETEKGVYPLYVYDHFLNNGYLQRVFKEATEQTEPAKVIEVIRNTAATFKVAIVQSEMIYDLWQDARVVNQTYADELYQAWLAGGHDPDNLIKNAYPAIIAAGNQNPPNPQSPTPPTPGTWQPPTAPGLHKIEIPSTGGQELFHSLRVPEGILLSTYGLNTGGARIYLFDGKDLHLELQTDCESLYNLFRTKAGKILATSEHYARIYERISAGNWTLRFGKGDREWNRFYIREKADGTLVSNRNLYGMYDSCVDVSHDGGRTWQEGPPWTEKAMFGMCVDGNDVYLAGKIGNAEAVIDESGNVVTSYDNQEYKGYMLWGVVKKAGIWNYGTWNGDPATRDGSFINYFDGVNATQAADQVPPYVQDMELGPDGKRWALCTNDWDVEGKDSLLRSSVNGLNDWKTDIAIPCAHLMNMSFADGGVYMTGGLNNVRGELWFYRPEE